MDTGELQGDDLVRERLREATSGDATVRQLRRRYDSLRHDYEQLLDRLADLEGRFSEPEQPGARPAVAVPSDPLAGIDAVLFAPLLSLRESYAAAGMRVQTIVAALDQLAAAVPGVPHVVVQPQTAAPDALQSPEPEVRRPTRPAKLNLDVRGSGFGDLLDFQERLSAVAGVSRVSINAIDADRATLIVELEQANTPTDG
jgi:hypothetical protein